MRDVILQEPMAIRQLWRGPWVTNGHELLILAPKCGSSSAAKYFQHGTDGIPVGTYNADVLDRYCYRTLVIRNPAERFRSIWRYLFEETSYEALVDTFLSAPSKDVLDIHIRPQVDYTLGYELTRVITLEHLASEHPGFPTINTSNAASYPLSTYRQDELYEFYADDWKLYEATL